MQVIIIIVNTENWSSLLCLAFNGQHVNRQYTAVSVCPMKLCKQWTAIKQQLQHQQQQQVRLTTNTSNIATRIYCRPALVYLFHVFSGIFKKFYVFKFPPDHSGQQRHYVLELFTCSSVRPCYNTCQQDILRMNEPILMQFPTSGQWGQDHQTINFRGQKINSHGHTAPK